MSTYDMDIWAEFDDWLKTKNVFQSGFSKILKNLNELDKVVTSQVPQFSYIVQCMKDSKIVKDYCFG